MFSNLVKDLVLVVIGI
ncbi:hypothetical protein LINGRAPRIM_LOCUS2771 [Linum grandiflorum]